MKITWLRSTWIMTALVITLTTAFSFLTAAEGHQLLQSNPVEYAREYILNQDFKTFQAVTGYFALLITVFAVGLDYQFIIAQIAISPANESVLHPVVVALVYACVFLVVSLVLTQRRDVHA